MKYVSLNMYGNNVYFMNLINLSTENIFSTIYLGELGFIYSTGPVSQDNIEFPVMIPPSHI